MNKKPWLSKTLLLNFLAGGFALFCQPCDQWLAQNSSNVLAAMAGFNMLLRLITKDKISLHD